MSDLVNDYFHKFYPVPRVSSKMTYSSMLGGMWSYDDNSISKIFPAMVCADGFRMSVQGHWGAYSSPRDDFADHYSNVEVGFPSAREDLLMDYIDGGENSDPLESVYGFVPVATVIAIIEKHGGLIEAPATP